MPRPIPTPVMHFTRVEHLPSIIANGLESDTRAQASGSLKIEIGDLGVKRRRRKRSMPLWPGGVIADYVPFYFGDRSPMMLQIHTDRVLTYQEGCDRIIYLVTTLERLDQLGLTVRLSDRNAAKAVTAFIDLSGDIDGHIDWPLMKQRMWKNTVEEPDRQERRMAECLVHQVVPWSALHEVVAKNDSTADEARTALAAAALSVKVAVRPTWYY